LFQAVIAASFQSVWYWLLSLVLWTQVCHRILGVPHDMIRRACRQPGIDARVDQLAHIGAERVAGLHDRAGVPLAALAGFALAALFTVGFVYRVEVAQAAFMLAFPLAGVWLGTLRLALRLRRHGARGAALRRALLRRRLWNRVIAVVALLAAALVGLAHHPRLLLP
jgi:hypothetical protein